MTEEIYPEYIYSHQEDDTYLLWEKYPNCLIKIPDPTARQKFMLALNLKKVKTPLEAPHLYTESRHQSGLIMFEPTNACFDESNSDEESLSDCCQTGCRGCPWAEENIYNRS